MFNYCLENEPIQLSLEELPEVPSTPTRNSRCCFYKIPVFFQIVLLFFLAVLLMSAQGMIARFLDVNLVTIQEGHIGLYYRLK